MKGYCVRFMKFYPISIRHQRGFTLIELSVVLVVIGLLIGSIFVGQDLIYAARIRKALKELDTFTTAVNAFNIKYNALPGDMVDPDKIFGPQSLQFDPNGDGKIIPKNEGLEAWRQLQQAKMVSLDNIMIGANDSPLYLVCRIAGAPIGIRCHTKLNLNVPRSKAFYNAGWSFAINKTNGHNMLVLGEQHGSKLDRPAITAFDALSMDTKIDDGLPKSGAVQTPDSGVPGGSLYAEFPACGSSGAYDVSIDATYCALYFDLPVDQ